MDFFAIDKTQILYPIFSNPLLGYCLSHCYRNISPHSPTPMLPLYSFRLTPRSLTGLLLLA